MNKYNTDCFSHNVLLDLLNLRRQLCIPQPFGKWFLYSKKSPLFTFLWSVLEQDRRFELPPSVWKTDVLTVNTNLAYKRGEPSSPRAIFNVVFFDEMVSTQTLRLFLRRLLRKSYERDYLVFTSIYDEKNVWFALKCKKRPPLSLKKQRVFLRLYQFLVWLFSHYFTVKQSFEPLLYHNGKTCQEYSWNL